MKKISKVILVLISLLAIQYSSLVTSVYAQPVGPIGPVGPQPVNAINFGKIFNAIPGFKFNNSKLDSVISEAIVYAFAISGFLLLLYIIYGGFQLMTSGGDPEKLKGAKDILTRAVVGFVIIFISYWIVQLVGIAFGITAVKDVFK